MSVEVNRIKDRSIPRTGRVANERGNGDGLMKQSSYA